MNGKDTALRSTSGIYAGMNHFSDNPTNQESNLILLTVRQLERR